VNITGAKELLFTSLTSFALNISTSIKLVSPGKHTICNPVRELRVIGV